MVSSSITAAVGIRLIDAPSIPKIEGEDNRGEMLIEVLARVNLQLDELLNEMFHEVSQQFASTYRYVKNRT